MEAYSVDLRERVLADCDAGLGTKQVAAKFQVSEPWVRRIKQCRRETGRVAPLPRSGGRPKKITGAREKRLKQLLKKRPDATCPFREPQFSGRFRSGERTFLRIRRAGSGCQPALSKRRPVALEAA